MDLHLEKVELFTYLLVTLDYNWTDQACTTQRMPSVYELFAGNLVKVVEIPNLDDQPVYCIEFKQLNVSK